MPKPLIDIKELTKDYGENRAVDHLNLSIGKGEIFGLLGPNGAGKTTIILTLLGLSEPTSGTITVKGFNATSEPLKVKKITGYLPDEVGFRDNSTGRESLIYTALLNGIPHKEAAELADELLEIVDLSEVGSKKTKTYSKGMKQRLGLADVLMKRPEIIILDEPTVGIDPKGIIDFLDLIRDLSKNRGITVLLSSHLLHQVQIICDRVGILVEGQLRAVGNIKDLAKQLFDHEETSITVEVKPITEEMIQKLTEDERIKDIQEERDTIILKGSKNLVPDISKTIIESGGDLYRISCKEYGLDEIYHHYFKD
ncbi:MAG TPA: ABC transporter ATP-binding protein [Balneolales bacterium]|nr:ABC transporter ATP-binding protein [Balneolales bacterium]